jgi:Peptidase family M23
VRARSRQVRGLAAVLLAGWVFPVHAAEVTRRVGRLAIRVDTGRAVPGGFFVVVFESSRPLGRLTAIFEGRRAASFDSSEGLRALVPIPLTTPPGEWTLGVELAARCGIQHMKLEVPVAPRAYTERSQSVPEPLQLIARASDAGADGRRLMLLVRTESPAAAWTGGFTPPVPTPPTPDSFGAHERRIPDLPLERLKDGAWGERQRSLEYAVRRDAPVNAPAGGAVVFAGKLALTGKTVVVDHGQGLVSALQYLDRIDVSEGESLARGREIGRSGLSPDGSSLLAWSVHLHGIAVDPRLVLERLR